MNIARPSEGKAPGWVAASIGEPCPLCGSVHDCSVREGGDFARCMAVVSARPMLGGGWLHALPITIAPHVRTILTAKHEHAAMRIAEIAPR